MAPFEVFVDDNYHFMDEKSRYSAGVYPSYEEALARARGIVDECLAHHYLPGMTSGELYEGYTGFGEDPFIIPEGNPRFSAWEYARLRCTEICAEEDAAAQCLREPGWPSELMKFREVLGACSARAGLDEKTTSALQRFVSAVEDFPNSMPRAGRWYWLRLERGEESFTVYIHPDKFQLMARAPGRDKVDCEVRFRGSGRLDRRDGDAAEVLELMYQAAFSHDFTFKISTGSSPN